MATGQVIGVPTRKDQMERHTAPQQLLEDVCLVIGGLNWSQKLKIALGQNYQHPQFTMDDLVQCSVF